MREAWGPSANRLENDGPDAWELAERLDQLAIERQQTQEFLEEILNTKRPEDQERAQVGHRITVRDETTGTTRRVLLLRHHGGNKVGPDLITLALTAPFGRAMLGRKPGEKVTIQTSAGQRESTILAIE